MSLNEKLIQRKISLIRKDLEKIFPLSNLSLSEYLAKEEYETLAERYLERIIGRMIDINYHILTELENETPQDYYTSFIDLGKKKYLDSDLAEKLADSAGLRNRLAHEYDEIDEKKVYEAMRKAGEDVGKYLASVFNLLEKADPDNQKPKKLF